MRIAAAALLLLSSGCCIAPGFVPAQRAFFSVIEPEFRAYVAADPKLSDDQKASRFDLLAAEEAVLSEAEK